MHKKLMIVALLLALVIPNSYALAAQPSQLGNDGDCDVFAILVVGVLDALEAGNPGDAIGILVDTFDELADCTVSFLDRAVDEFFDEDDAAESPVEISPAKAETAIRGIFGGQINPVNELLCEADRLTVDDLDSMRDDVTLAAVECTDGDGQIICDVTLADGDGNTEAGQFIFNREDGLLCGIEIIAGE